MTAVAPETAQAPASTAAPAAEGGQALEGGNYDVIRRRLLEQASELATKAEALNAKRKKTFGGSELALIATERVRTENNCVPRDIVSIKGRLLFGYNVFVGLRSETNVGEVLCLHEFAHKPDGTFDMSPAPAEAAAFLADPAFVKEFKELYRYTKDAFLLQLKRMEGRLLAIFQIGATVRDTKVFRWSIDAAGRLTYMDARGDVDNVPPRAHSFEWTQTTRDDQVSGRHPHISVLDECFVETIAGDLTIKIENNTETGQGILTEPVEDPNQTLDDADVSYARIGNLILLRIKPFRETAYRYFVFNTRLATAARVDAIGLACVELPEGHGLVFPGGYYLTTGELKIFEQGGGDLEFERAIKSPNGEDVMYVFHRHGDGSYLLLPYNMIRKEIANPIPCHGYSLFDDGKMVVFRALTQEPTRVHPMQVWQTPFTTAEFAAAAPTDGSYLAKVGNADLVRGISDALSLRRLAVIENPTRQTFEDLIAAGSRMTDAYYWLGHEDANDLASVVATLRKTAELIVDEFEKVTAIKKRAADALADAVEQLEETARSIRPEDLNTVDAYMVALTTLRKQRGHLITLRELRYMDLARVEALEKESVAHFDHVSRGCVEFLLRGDSLQPLIKRLTDVVSRVEATKKASELSPIGAELDQINEGLGLFAEVVGGLKIEDATARTKILEGISEVYAQLNRARATYQGRRKDLSTSEGRAEFLAQFKLFGQAVTSALALCDTPERCDEQLSRLLVQLEELEGKFGEFDEFIGDLADKREEVNDAIGSKRQTLLDERQRRAQNLMGAADRIAQGIARRARTFASADELNAYFAGDAMVLKLKDLAEELLALGDSVKSDEVQSRLKTARQDALRALRDRSDLYEDGGNTIKLGRHRFNVHTQQLELALVPRAGALALHLTGTDFYETIDDPELTAHKELWEQTMVSETRDVYRGEFLACSILFAAERGQPGVPSTDALHKAALTSGGLLEVVRAFAAERHDEGYERGVHDADAALLLEKLSGLLSTAGMLRFESRVRALACAWWASLDDVTSGPIHRRAQSLARLRAELGSAPEQDALATEIAGPMAKLAEAYELGTTAADARRAARYLVQELAAARPRFVTSAAAVRLRDQLLSRLDLHGGRSAFDDDIRALDKLPAERLRLVRSWIDAVVRAAEPALAHAALEAAVLVVTDRKLDRETSTATTEVVIQGLLGQHARISERTMRVRLDEMLGRLEAFLEERAPAFRAFRDKKHQILEREKKRLRIGEFTPRVLSSFVRNRLIDEVYLPLIGNNLAKQLGAAGEGKRTDLMGMLLLISPPGYGKTTLMEYIASKLGLVFMKVNGPALGHDVRSIDPADAPNATARQEVDKINLALEMGNNVMLYLDDIQHTHPELLQKFISLCDAQRRIEGVWKGSTRTYDLRGKKFCVVMAGNPYTESGDKFQIPDMLANRADTYNLGDILEGKDDLFALSYVENSLTSNQVLAPLAGRPAGDVHKLIRMARGEELPITELEHAYSAAEVAEIVAVLQRMFRVQKVLLAVNALYISSASQDDAFRTEPPFKLQGSYRNMNKLAEKIVSAHTDEEIDRLVDDHYGSESQTLTTGAEHNLLKLAELRGRMDDAQRARWDEIKKGFVRVKMMGGKETDPVARVTGTLTNLGQELEGIRRAVTDAASAAQSRKGDSQVLEGIRPALEKLEKALAAVTRPKLEVKVQSDGAALAEQLAQQLAMVERSILPIARSVAEAAGQVTAHAAASQAAATRAAAELAAQAVAARLEGDDDAVPSADPVPLVAAKGPNPQVVQFAGLDRLDARLSELSERLRALDAKILAGGGVVSTSGSGVPPPLYEASLAANSATNFYRGLSGSDIVEHGGIFVATYRKIPAPGTQVALRVLLPGGADFEVLGVVEWTLEPRDVEASGGAPGFGAKLIRIKAQDRQLIDHYVRSREPLLYDSPS